MQNHPLLCIPAQARNRPSANTTSMSTQSCFTLTLALLLGLSLAIRYRAAEPAYDLAVREDDRIGQFLFYTYPLPGGRHGYTARLVHLPFPCRDQTVFGVLSLKDWEKLRSFQRLDKIPSYDLPLQVNLRAPWGSLERNGSTVSLRYADWWELNRATEMGEALERLRQKSRRIL